MEYIGATTRIAEVALKALPTRASLAKDGLRSDPDALIAEVAICATVWMHYVWLDFSFHVQLNTVLNYLKCCIYMHNMYAWL